MINHYLIMIQNKKKNHKEIYEQILIEVFGEVLPWNQIENQDNDKLRKIAIELERKIAIKESPIDIAKMSRAIQNSRSGVGGSAMTRYHCHFCGSEEWWGNTAVPNICSKCASNMAEVIAINCDVLKQEVKDQLTFDVQSLLKQMDALIEASKANVDRKSEKGLMEVGALLTLEQLKQFVLLGAFNKNRKITSKDIKTVDRYMAKLLKELKANEQSNDSDQ